MEKYILIFFFCINSIIPIEDNYFSGVYNFIYDKNNLFVYHNSKIKIYSSEKCKPIANFGIKKIANSEYYYIEHIRSKSKLSGSPGKLEFIKEENKDTYEWTFIKSLDNYKIKNKNQCYIILTSNKITCGSYNNAINFKIEKIYEEVNHSKEDLELIDKEPIDILVKYIDLRDPDLVREGLPQIKKDEDNEELRYSIRSILKNIPWVRKIFILMPNKKVRYFKDYDLIKEKIVYVLDKDLIGFDSANTHSFQFRAWMMEKFNMSENFIIMDDDYFIGSPLNKSDFFYVNNGKVVPAIITKDFIELSKDFAENEHKYYKKRLTNKQKSDDFFYTLATTYLFILKLFESPIFVPKFTHNAIPCNTKELKEIYDIINNSKYKYPTLDSLVRHPETLQFQTFYMEYTFSKFNKKVNHITYNYINNKVAITGKYKSGLFVINTGGDKCPDIYFKKQRIVMESLFPEPTPYELNINYNNFSLLAFNVIKEIEEDKKKLYEKIDNIYIKYRISVFFLILVIIYFLYKQKRIPKNYQIVSDEAQLNDENNNNIDSLEEMKTK